MQERNYMMTGFDIGKLPPQDKQAEIWVLSALIQFPGAIYEIHDKLSEEAFYYESHKEICSAILALYNNDKKIDLLTVTDQLKKSGKLDSIGGALFVTQITGAVSSSAHIKQHFEIVKSKYVQREAINTANNIMMNAYSEELDSDELVNYMNSEIEKINEINAGNCHSEHISHYAKGSEESLRSREKAVKENKLRGIPTPWVGLNKLLQGWQPGLIFIGSRPSIGKCLGLGTKIIMFDGSIKKVENIVSGDVLMGPDSKPRNVLSTVVGKGKMYVIKQMNGYNYRCNEDHILTLKVSGKDFQKTYGEYRQTSVRDYFKLPSRLRDKLKGYKVKIDFSENNDLKIDPYILGIWLGDGSLKKCDITNPDIEIVNAIKEYAIKESFPFRVFKSKDKCQTLIMTDRGQTNDKNSFCKRLKYYNIYDNKRIPDCYIINSEKIRLELLAGLLDSDGYLCDGRSYEITQKIEELAYQIKYLCDTLGFGTSLKKEIKSIKSIGFSGYYYRLHITGDVYRIPLKVKRKIAPEIQKKANYATTYGVKVIEDVVDNYYGFELDGDGLFLLEDCTVTHNTSTALAIAKTAAEAGHATNIYSLETSGLRLTDRLFLEGANMNANNFRSGYMSASDWNEFNKAKQALSKLPLFIDDNPYLHFNYLKARSRIMKKKGLCKMIIVDYLQLAQVDSKSGKNRDVALGEFTRNCKNLANELDIPIILLAQLNRLVESRTDKKPELSDIRETGSAEGDADVAILLHRPERYGITEDKKGNDHRNKIYLLLEKQKDGPIGEVTLIHDGTLHKFKDYIEPTFRPIESSNRDKQLPPEKDDGVEDIPDNPLPF